MFTAEPTKETSKVGDIGWLLWESYIHIYKLVVIKTNCSTVYKSR